jgi:hypothetical protein
LFDRVSGFYFGLELTRRQYANVKLNENPCSNAADDTAVDEDELAFGLTVVLRFNV